MEPDTMNTPAHYLSTNDGFWRVISNAAPIHADKLTPWQAIEAAAQMRVIVAPDYWDGNRQQWQPLSSLEEPAR
jgi:hypothetical protein